MAKKKAETKKEETQIKAMSPELLTQNLFVLKNMVDTLNIAIAGVAKAADIKADALDKLTAEEYVDWVQNTLHPIVRATNKLHEEWAEITAKEAEKAVKEGEK